MGKPKLLDLFCKQGGASRGYSDAGFDVTGVDIDRQPRYPFNFIQGDALSFVLEHGHEFDVIAASPPCQFGSEMTPTEYKSNHENLIPATRAALIQIGKPYIIENVEGSRTHLINPLMLCGSMLGLPIWRHRYFENNFGLMWSPASCRHNFIPVLPTGRGMRKVDGKRFSGNKVDEIAEAMGIDWMNKDGLRQAIPPAFTRWIGEQLITALALNKEKIA